MIGFINCLIGELIQIGVFSVDLVVIIVSMVRDVLLWYGIVVEGGCVYVSNMYNEIEYSLFNIVW